MLVFFFFKERERGRGEEKGREGEPELSMLRLGDKNIALLAVGSFYDGQQSVCVLCN